VVMGCLLSTLIVKISRDARGVSPRFGNLLGTQCPGMWVMETIFYSRHIGGRMKLVF